MRVYIKTLKGQTMTVDIDPNDTFDTLRSII